MELELILWLLVIGLLFCLVILFIQSSQKEKQKKSMKKRYSRGKLTNNQLKKFLEQYPKLKKIYRITLYISITFLLWALFQLFIYWNNENRGTYLAITSFSIVLILFVITIIKFFRNLFEIALELTIELSNPRDQ
ncbi:MAG: hypothetical protein JSW07_16330 [bacterium]|nr:MAG: hypothetical protein JSW07_16330 [bacterium]